MTFPKMTTRVYNYLDEVLIGISAPDSLFSFIEGNIDEVPQKTTEEMVYDGIVHVEEGNFTKIERNSNFSYASTKPNMEKSYLGKDYFRYASHVQTIWRKNSSKYEVKNFLPGDDSGLLRCFKKIYYANPKSSNKSLIHSTLVEVEDAGVLLVGKKRTGKTTIAFNLIDKLDAILVEGGNSLISYSGTLRGYYLPRPIFARFSTIARSSYLNNFLEDFAACQSTQPFDIEAIIAIINARAFEVDSGLNFSREVFRNLSGKKTKRYTQIKTIIFPEYSTDGLEIMNISESEAAKRIMERELPKNIYLEGLIDQDKIEKIAHSKISSFWFEGIKCKVMKFGNNCDFSESLLEDLVS